MAEMAQSRSRSPSRVKPSEASAQTSPLKSKTQTKPYTEEQRVFIAITARQVPKAEKLYDMYNEKFPENRKDLWEIKRMRTLTLEHNHLGNVEVEGKWAEKVKTRSEARDRRRAWKKELDAQMYGDMLFGRTMEMPIVIKDQEDDTYQVITSKKRIDNLEGLMRELQADSDDEAGSAKIDMKSERKAQEQELAPKTSEES